MNPCVVTSLLVSRMLLIRFGASPRPRPPLTLLPALPPPHASVVCAFLFLILLATQYQSRSPDTESSRWTAWRRWPR